MRLSLRSKQVGQDKVNPEAVKELEDLTKLVAGREPPRAKKLTQKEAGAVLDYVEALEKSAGKQTAAAKHVGYNENDKRLGLLKLFGIAAGLPYEDERVE